MSLFDFTFGREAETEGKVQGIALATVIDNRDMLGLGRVKLSLPWLPGVEPWARVAAMTAGTGYGTFFQPKVGNEVVVAFNQGNIAEPVVLGALWSTLDRPPASAAFLPETMHVIRTPLGHVVEIDEAQAKITVSTPARQRVEISPSGISLLAAEQATSVSISTTGEVAVTATTSISLKAPKVSIAAGTVDIHATGVGSLVADGACTVRGSIVNIN